MKTIFLFIVMSFTCKLFSQDLIKDNFPTKDGLIYYSEVIIVDSTLTADKLYLNAKKWLSLGFKSSKAVIQTDDKDAKLIIIKSFVKKGHNIAVANPKNWFLLKIEMKNGKYKYSLYNIIYEFDINYMGQNSHTEKAFEEWMQPSDKKMNEKKRQKINEALTNYCKELDGEFRDVIALMKKEMINKESENW